MHNRIIIFASFIYLKGLSVLFLLLFRTFLYSLSRNGAMFQMFLTFELPKLTFSCCHGCRIYQQKLADLSGQFHLSCFVISCIIGYPEMFSFSQALEISRQYLLLRTVSLQSIVAGCL